jgi:KUP system potassium uptake protein
MQEQLGQKATAALSLAALGVVYGDIGTSPLYTIREVFAGAHHPVPITPENIYGILSLIFWSLVVIIALKYALFVMRADNRGEGGIMALMALVLRGTGAGKGRDWLMLMGLFGAALFYGDSVITPAISVLSAVEGLEIATPAFKPYIVPIAMAVLAALFVVQRRGTARVGALFGPVMVLWFLILGLLGIVNIAASPGVLAALSPVHALGFFAAKPVLGFFSLGAAVLAVTGGEALYADMGHFGRRPVQLAWFGLVMPALVLNYFGQGALLLAHPEAIQNPFYLLAPGWALYPMVVLSTVATVIASQAVISGAYSLTHQAIQLGYAPRMEVQHTSSRQIGQIYLPPVNWMLLVAVAALVLGFGSSSSLAAAYGIAVTGTMVITTLLAYIVARRLWGWSRLTSGCIAGIFLAVDLVYFVANLVKIREGGWFPLLLGIGIFLLLTTWKQGRSLLHATLAESGIELSTLLDHLPSADEAHRVAGTAVFLTTTPERVPHALLHNLKHNKVLHERVVIVTVEVLDVPRVPPSQRVAVERLPHDFWRVKVYFGFMDEPDLPSALEWCGEQGLHLDLMQTSFFLGRETLIPKLGSRMPLWREKVFIALYRNSGSASSYFQLPPNRVVELGTQVVL